MLCRLHAVIQFRARDGAAFVLDPGSTHGTYLNKQRLPAGKHVPLRCGRLPAAADAPCRRRRVHAHHCCQSSRG